MWNWIFVTLVMLFGSQISDAHPLVVGTPSTTYDAQVVLQLTSFDHAALDRLSREVGRSKNVTLEYSCLWSGIVILKCSGIPAGERADVITYVRRILTTAGIERGVEFLHVHVEPAGPGKC